MKRTIHAVAIACTLAMFSGQLLAQSGIATVKLSNIQILLEDLDLQDGIAPSASFSHQDEIGSRWRTWTAVSPLDEAMGSMIVKEDSHVTLPLQASPVFLTPGQVQTDFAGQSASVISTNDAITATAKASITEEMRQAPVHPQWGVASAITEPTGVGQSFFIGAHTLMRITGEYLLSASTDPGYFNFASAGFEFTLSGESDIRFFDREQSEVTSLSQNTTRSGTFELLVANTSNLQGFGLMTGNVRANVTLATAVPEPQSLVLALCGLAVSALIGRRRASKR